MAAQAIVTRIDNLIVMMDHLDIRPGTEIKKTYKCQEIVMAIFDSIALRDPNQSEYLQAAREVIESLYPLFEKYPKYISVLRAICEPERLLQFRVAWVDDQGNHQVNRGFRCQFNQSIGPYKGGLRFHPSVNQSIVKFLGFEQIFKNALTGLPMGGGKGGSDFNPKGKSNAEILRFCQSFIQELWRLVGPDTDVPAGDIGVGGREIGYLYGEWKRLTTKSVGVLTGKGYGWGGSLIRPEATGYGLVYITQFAIKDLFDESIKNKKIAISGSGNVALFAAEKVYELGGSVVSFSDSNGSCINNNGFTKEEFKAIRDIKDKRGRLSDFIRTNKNENCKYYINSFPWQYVKCDIALPSATQNEINGKDAQILVDNGCKYVAEGANMPSLPEAIEIFKKNCKLFIPAKAANAGGVAVSGLEMAQNSQRTEWTRSEVDNKLKNIMKHIYHQCITISTDLGDKYDFQLGANAAGFKKVADAMIQQGYIL